MARSRYELDEKKIQRWQKEGRGQGRGEDYKPWLTVQDVPSKGVSSRVPQTRGWTVNRKHQFFSELELHFFYILEWLPYVTDIREQFPLLNRDCARDIAKGLNVAYPRDWKTNESIVMTCDFIITVQCEDGSEVDIARTLKPKGFITKRVLEKFQIEQIYLKEELKIRDWGIITQVDLPHSLTKNIKRIYYYYYREYIGIDDKHLEELSAELTKRILKSNRPLRIVTSECDQTFKIQPGSSLTLAYHLIAQRYWQIDMMKLINTNLPLKLLNESDILYF